MSFAAGREGTVLLYGANGYTGRLILTAALREGLPVRIAGRRREAIEQLAAEHGVGFRVFDLESPGEAARGLDGVSLLVLAAGPFSRTSARAFEACLRAKAGYLDITGEVAVFESLFARHEEARAAGIAVLPGAGFDVVPSDCLAAQLSALLPGATSLELAFRGFRPSAGTAKTMLESLPAGGLARRGGRLERVPSGWKMREVPFLDRTRLAMSVPWGDLATAWRSTGIPNIVTYTAATPSSIRLARWTRAVMPVLRFPPLRRLLERRIESRIAGPTAEDRHRERSQLWGRVEAPDGRAVEGRMETLEGYAFTAESTVACARRILAGELVPGVWTPSQAFGPNFVAQIPDTRIEIPSPG